MMIGAVAFDFDGTLVRSNRIKRQAFYDAVADIPAAAAVLDALHEEGFSGDRYALFHEVCRRLDPVSLPGERERAVLLAKRYGELCRESIARCDEVPGAGAALEALRRQDIPLYLVSATPQIDLRPIVRDRGLEATFSAVFGRPVGKQAHLRAILKESGLSPESLVMVGDGRDDQSAAAAVRCHFIAVTDAPVAPIEGAGISIPDLRQLREALLGIAGAASFSRSVGPKYVQE
jgi:phosphoglycolate phosphatase